MKPRGFVTLLLAGAAIGLVMAHKPAPEAELSELFDPAFIARNMCGDSPLSGMFFPPAAAADTAPATQIFKGLGDNSFKVTAANPQAQAFFDQGLRLVYAFNYGEALASFRAASAADPSCAMCAWGEALALGPTLNADMPEENNAPAMAAMKRAQELAQAATSREQALIGALALRYSDDPKKSRDQLNAAYADAMFKVYQQFSTDVDIASLHADAALNDSRTSGWWTANGKLPTPRNASALVALERALRAAPTHAGAIHYYIHAMDSGPRPEKAEPFANTLAAQMPAAGHIVHMPAHIYYRRGRYIEALNANLDALKVDDAYLAAGNNADGVYSHQLYAHNLHFAFAAAGMAGDARHALSLAKRLETFLATGVVQRPDFYLAAALMPQVKFAAPDELLKLPEPAEAAIYPRGVHLYARASAYVRKNDVAAARKELAVLTALRTETDLDRMMQSGGRTPQMLQLAESVALGRIAAAEKKWDEAVKHFTDASVIQDQLRSFDPPVWDFPVRQAVGLTLLKAGKTNEAIEALRSALQDAPNNGIVLYALAQASKAAGDTAAATQYTILFKKAWVGETPPDLGRI
ncbi:MAG: tetratricopeptide repeat protein [Rhodospirillaceae bacterium]|nr:tetratricopeptide repeat protein [Rhodospirillaceae bacterium]